MLVQIWDGVCLTALERPQRLLTIKGAVREGAERLLARRAAVLEGPERLLTTGEASLEGPERLRKRSPIGC